MKKNLEGVDKLFGEEPSAKREILKVNKDVEIGQEELVTKSYRMYPSIHRALKKRAVDEGKKDWQILDEALRAYLIRKEH